MENAPGGMGKQLSVGWGVGGGGACRTFSTWFTVQQTIDFNQGGGEIDHKSPRGASLLPCYLRDRCKKINFGLSERARLKRLLG